MSAIESITSQLEIIISIKVIFEIPLTVCSGVNPIGIVKGQFGCPVEDIIYSFHALHEGMVLIGNLVFPCSETAAGPNVHVLLQVRQHIGNASVSRQRGCRITMVNDAVIRRYDLIRCLCVGNYFSPSYKKKDSDALP
jgi:hypothetical protein